MVEFFSDGIMSKERRRESKVAQRYKINYECQENIFPQTNYDQIFSNFAYSSVTLS